MTTEVNLNIDNIKAQALEELTKEMLDEATDKIKDKLREIERAKKVLKNLQEELKVILADLAE